MKKIISVLLSILLFVLPLTVCAEDSEALPVMGDTTGDSKVTAADARQILRYAASLDPKDGADMMRVDTDGNGVLNAADARQTLRVSASLSRFSCGFDANGTPNAVKLINNRTVVVSMKITAFDESASVTVAMNGNNICLVYDGGEINGALDGMESMGILYLDGATYCLCEMNGSKLAIMVPDSMKDEFFEDGFTVEEITDTIFSVIPKNPGNPQKVTQNGTEQYIYSYEIDGFNYIMYTDSRAVPQTIVSGTTGSDEIIFSSVSYSGIDGYFDLSDYVIM